ncbi:MULTISPECIES: hypothetical protein [Streptomyces]|uniref:Uncharacterized protein n=1 Tax=Streptomyces dengpaensis TaxID=2049881 RepID=A0ABM6SML0_9ACTN|nr:MULTISPECIES: hypothetical protein [Streptomyces]AVH55899.1 hypothetical protein C4B68_09080 [Streptomyces dengpaensis]PIB12150.1 hypothetical protein B1C81_03015 [Streptomyces sp. HG99]
MATPAVAAVAVAVLAVGSAGCVRAQPAERPDRPSVPALSRAAVELALRTSPYREDQRALRRAEDELTRRCMAAQGFGQPAASSGASARDDDPWHPDPEARRTLGYGFSDTGPSPDDQYPPGLPAAQRDAYARALTGDPGRRATLRLSSGPQFTFATTGCIARSRIRLFGDVMAAARVSYVPQEAYNAIRGQIAVDATMRRALGDWTSCMRKRGVPFASMEDARAAAARRSHEVPPTKGAAPRSEVRIAEADAECALAVDLPGVIDRVGPLYLRELTAEQRRDLNAAADLRLKALQRARALRDAQPHATPTPPPSPSP